MNFPENCLWKKQAKIMEAENVGQLAKSKKIYIQKMKLLFIVFKMASMAFMF